MFDILDRVSKAEARINSLVRLTNIEDSKGRFRVILDYDNYQDGARVLDGDGNVLGECYDLFDEIEDEDHPDMQFLVAIDRAIENHNNPSV